jgi:probable phosphoglycerate mutase
MEYVLEADGGSRGNPGPAAYGTVILQAGVIVRELAGVIGVATNNVAEYRGLLAGLEWIAAETAQAGDESTMPLVEARLDSKLVVEQMSGRWRIKHPDMKELAVRARRAYPPESVRYRWVPREQNKRADALVNEVLDAQAAGMVRAVDRGR